MPRNQKKREDTYSLINLSELNRIRQQKQKIVNSPNQQNWKKVIVMEELLNLHEQKQNISATMSPNYSKAQFWAMYRSNNAKKNQETPWDNNQDHQIGKYHKMIDGLNRWQQHFQQFNIGKVLRRIDKRTKNKTLNSNNAFVSENIQQRLKKRYLNKKIKDKSKDIFSSFNKCLGQKSSCFVAQRQQIDRLKNRAINKYGVNFGKNNTRESVDADFRDYKRKDQEYFQQFAQTMKNSRIKYDRPCNSPRSHRKDDDRIDLKTFGRPISGDFKIIPRSKTSQSKRYLRIM